MPDREKVIKGMVMCISQGECSPDDCPYYDRPDNASGLCWDRLMTDAIALLKEQEAVEPIFASDEMGCMTYYVCPACKIAIDYGDKFCRHCGRKMIWEEME